VREGDSDRLILVYPYLGHDLRIIIGYEEQETAFWNVITGIPSRVCRNREVHRVERTDEREPSSNDAVRPRFATLSLPKKS